MSDWLAIALDEHEAHEFDPVDVPSPLERAARLSEPVRGRCLHGFELGKGLCGVRGCKGSKLKAVKRG